MERLTPKSARGEMDFKILERDYPLAVQRLLTLGRVSLREIGVDWNYSVLAAYRSGKGIEYCIASDEDFNSQLHGRMRNVGYNHIGVEVFNPSLIGRNGLYNDCAIRTLSEAVNYVSKLEILEGVEILPSGLREERVERGVGRGSHSDGDLSQYRAFAAELLRRAEGIIVGRVGEAFGDYIVARMKSGFFVAYNTNYGEAPYIVTDLSALEQDKQTVIRKGDAIRFRRDRRGDWAKKIFDEVG